jgi:hypothetical protein
MVRANYNSHQRVRLRERLRGKAEITETLPGSGNLVCDVVPVLGRFLPSLICFRDVGF